MGLFVLAERSEIRKALVRPGLGSRSSGHYFREAGANWLLASWRLRNQGDIAITRLRGIRRSRYQHLRSPVRLGLPDQHVMGDVLRQAASLVVAGPGFEPG